MFATCKRNKFHSLQVVSSSMKGHVSPFKRLSVLLITLLRIWEISGVLPFTIWKFNNESRKI